jgi:integrase
MTGLESALSDYLAVRRALGYKLKATERLLGQFVAYCEQAGAGVVTTDLALEWATLPVGAHISWSAQRLSMVRCFAVWLQTLDPTTEIPPIGLVTGRPRRAVPYLYTDGDVAALITAAGRLRSPLQAHTYQTLVGLLTVTGLRVGEAIRLDRSHVRLESGLVQIIDSKFNKSREVPLHPTSITALRRYTEHRDRQWPKPPCSNFFLSTTGTMLSDSRVRATYRTLTRQAGLAPRDGRCRPRIHDLRHTLACQILIDWHRDGLDVQTRLPLLSTWLGHLKPENTYWYLTAVPELLELAARRLEDTFEANQ